MHRIINVYIILVAQSQAVLASREPQLAHVVPAPDTQLHEHELLVGVLRHIRHALSWRGETARARSQLVHGRDRAGRPVLLDQLQHENDKRRRRRRRAKRNSLGFHRAGCCCRHGRAGQCYGLLVGGAQVQAVRHT